MQNVNAPIKEKDIRSFDNTKIHYYVAGKGKKTIVLSPGLGTPMNSFKKVIEQFCDKYTFITWECRSTYDSETPKDINHLGVKDHVADLAAICKAEKLDRFIMGGWSMGVQVSLEFYHQFPEKIRGLLLINGTYEHILDTALRPLPFPRYVLSALSKTAIAIHPVINPLIRLVLGTRLSPALLQLSTFVAEHEDFFHDTLSDFSQHQWHMYFKMMLQVQEHSAADYLKDVDVPTLITAGSQDRLTPCDKIETMHKEIADSEFFLIPQGTHFSLFEFPEIINLRLEKFLREMDPELFEMTVPDISKAKAKLKASA